MQTKTPAIGLCRQSTNSTSDHWQVFNQPAPAAERDRTGEKRHRERSHTARAASKGL